MPMSSPNNAPRRPRGIGPSMPTEDPAGATPGSATPGGSTWVLLVPAAAAARNAWYSAADISSAAAGWIDATIEEVETSATLVNRS